MGVSANKGYLVGVLVEAESYYFGVDIRGPQFP